ncbi:uncharacterized protein LOC131309344 [Rhododendron vialii]|uniref:uncharacterized protein LOC131309344 n=1 Tax=Rhododendron vialii TaxID=182163 RepID=UPI00265EA327|nr:uncharacterized protein LOC131309344 [Rhododendron vialii]
MDWCSSLELLLGLLWLHCITALVICDYALNLGLLVCSFSPLNKGFLEDEFKTTDEGKNDFGKDHQFPLFPKEEEMSEEELEKMMEERYRAIARQKELSSQNAELNDEDDDDEDDDNDDDACFLEDEFKTTDEGKNDFGKDHQFPLFPKEEEMSEEELEKMMEERYRAIARQKELSSQNAELNDEDDDDEDDDNDDDACFLEDEFKTTDEGKNDFGKDHQFPLFPKEEEMSEEELEKMMEERYRAIARQKELSSQNAELNDEDDDDEDDDNDDDACFLEDEFKTTDEGKNDFGKDHQFPLFPKEEEMSEEELEKMMEERYRPVFLLLLGMLLRVN